MADQPTFLVPTINVNVQILAELSNNTVKPVIYEHQIVRPYVIWDYI